VDGEILKVGREQRLSALELGAHNLSENMLRWLEANGARNEQGATRVWVQEHREGTNDVGEEDNQ